jgi:WSC domain
MKKLVFALLLATACTKVQYVEYFQSTPVSSYVGCYVDASTRALPDWLINSNTTVESCIAAATAAGYAYAGLEYGGQCFAGNSLGYAESPASQCDMPCQADHNEICGGVWRNSIYSTGVN